MTSPEPPVSYDRYGFQSHTLCTHSQHSASPLSALPGCVVAMATVARWACSSTQRVAAAEQPPRAWDKHIRSAPCSAVHASPFWFPVC
jgi:hypothetical protein